MTSPLQASDSKFKISAKSVVELEKSAAFDRLLNLPELERKARVSGVKLVQLSGNGIEPGASWQLDAKIRGRQTSFQLMIRELQQPDLVLLELISMPFTGHIQIYLKHKNQHLTTIRLNLSADPKTLSARLILHSLKLTKHRQRRRVERSLRALCRYLEASETRIR